MARYLSPKIDIVFKRIFCEHPHILKSFLNAILPLVEDHQIVELTYLPAEQVPQIPEFKNTIADVKCKDQQGNIFVVEMQVQWTTNFNKRLLYGASKTYTRQLKRGEDYHALRPVFGISLIDGIFEKKTDKWYHHYHLAHANDPDKTIDEIQLLFIELPKFQAKTFTEKKLQALWLRVMAELGETTEHIPEEWLEVPEIKEAIHLAEESAYTSRELEHYDKYWDVVSVQKTLMFDAELKGEERGEKRGLVKGKKIGFDEGKISEKIIVAQKLLSRGIPMSEIVGITELSLEKIKALAKSTRRVENAT
jgi:predicted transposase/invertase (TIGR01784 family)